MSTESEMPLFNIALRPVDAAIAAQLVKAAEPFASIESQYLLGPNALPHATLCMFRAPNQEAANKVFTSWKPKTKVDVTLADFKVNDSQKDQEIWWLALHLVKDEALMALQQDCFTHIAACGYAGLQKPETYDPHFTLARVNQPVDKQANPASLPEGLIIPCAVDLGLTSGTGVFLKSIVSAQTNRPTVPKFKP